MLSFFQWLATSSSFSDFFFLFFKEKMLLYGLEEQNPGQVSRFKVLDYFSLLLCGDRKLDASLPLMKFVSSTAAGLEP